MYFDQFGNAVGVSIHAPARGATFQRVIAEPLRLMFQSTRPRGARQTCEVLKI